MTQVYIALSIIAGIAVGVFLILMGLFFWYLLRTMREVQKSIGEFVRALDPLVRTGALQTLSTSSATMVDIGQKMLKSMGAINVTVAAFNQAFFSKETLAGMRTEPPVDGYASADDSQRFEYSEEAAALTERQDTLRKQGFETDANLIMTPTPDKMYGSNV